MTTAFQIAADILDPPEWDSPDRPPLEPHQKAPPPPWGLWLLEAGRGAGKTEACSRYFARYMHTNPGHRGRIIAPTYDDAVESCVKGPSGLMSCDPDVKFVVQPGGSKVIWPNGSEALVLGTPFPRDVDRLRAGGNRHIDWWEEMAANAQLGDAWDQAQFGLRLGDNPHSIASTTPRNTTAYRAIRKLDRVHLTHATLFDNPHNPQSWIDYMSKRYGGTRIGRQELGGELLDDIEGALWSRRTVEAARISPEEQPDMARMIVAIDPAAASGPDADDTGMVVAGLGVNGDVYLVDDITCHLPPDGWGQRAVRNYRKHRADGIVAEKNNGGEMVEYVIATADAKVPVKLVHASRGKQIRAQPVAALYGDGRKRQSRVHHVGSFPELEDQLCTWVPGEEDSPDRLDALVWAVTELMLEDEDEEYIFEDYQPVQIGADI
jgi:phage terminase large subunit-like protein